MRREDVDIVLARVWKRCKGNIETVFYRQRLQSSGLIGYNLSLDYVSGDDGYFVCHGNLLVWIAAVFPFIQSDISVSHPQVSQGLTPVFGEGTSVRLQFALARKKRRTPRAYTLLDRMT